MGIPDRWLGSNNNAGHNSDIYLDLVLNSQTGRTLKLKNNAATRQRILNIREGLKVGCNSAPITPCSILQKPCLFKIFEDPCENTNLADDPAYAGVLNSMVADLNNRVTRVCPSLNRPGGKCII